MEITSDNGAEYKAEFHQMCVKHGIDHRLITPGHPEANGMAERIVKVMKEGLRKYVLEHGVAAWPEQLPVIEFGYRTTPQRSTGFSPYFLVYGRHPVYPPQVRAMLNGAELDVEDPEAMLEFITQRARALREAMPVAYERGSSGSATRCSEIPAGEASRPTSPSTQIQSWRLRVCGTAAHQFSGRQDNQNHPASEDSASSRHTGAGRC